MLRVGVSASTILSASDRLEEVFWEGIDHVEFGSHPSHETSDTSYHIAPLLLEMKDMDVVLVWEHTPHYTPNPKFAREGFEWATGLLGRDKG